MTTTPPLSPNFSIYHLTPEQHARRERVRKACIETFGDDHELTGWCYRQSSEFGDWESPDNIAAKSDEDLQRVLARVEELGRGTTPKWRPVIKGRSSRRR